MERYKEGLREIPVMEEMDVVVIGGGPSGVAAAVTAAEQGMKTLIVERYGFFGGMTVAGLSGSIGGLYSSSVKQELKQIVYGFAGRFAEALKEKQGLAEPFQFGHTALSVHDPLSWKEVADSFVMNAGVHVLFHTAFSDVIMEENKLTGIIFENKDGRSAIRGKVFIDATGDGDVAVKAGAPYIFGREGSIQSPTMIFRMNNVDWEKVSPLHQKELEKRIDLAVQTGHYHLPRRHIFLFPSPRKNEALINATRISKKNGGTVNGTVTEDLTWSELEGRRQIREYERFLQDYVPGFENAYIMESATQIGIRQTRTILGEYTLTNEDVIQARKFENAITRSAWPIEVHGEQVQIVHLDDDYYEIPFEVMLPQKIEQIMTVGRCISAEHEALASARVTAQCFEQGFAAGMAAYLSIEQGISPKQIDVQQVRSLMIAHGAVL
ncbi:FAD-dependent oxidoreductase [Ammoniphilus sp. 3BR4]|uniref:FAD-dependent oxidoreductase n=1 Tax=Ammoniphilus sp. 3BR4 TaxID=3158265 RepID=UPI003464F64F